MGGGGGGAVCESGRWGGVTTALPPSTSVGCQLEPTRMTHLTPPLEPWLEIIGLFLQLNRWHTVPGWMPASVNTHAHKRTHTIYIFFSTSNLSVSKISAFSHRNIEAPPTYIQTENPSPLVPLKSLKIFPDRKKKMSLFFTVGWAGYMVKSAHTTPLYPQEVSGLCEGTRVVGITAIMIMATCRTVTDRQLAWTGRPCVAAFWAVRARHGCGSAFPELRVNIGVCGKLSDEWGGGKPLHVHGDRGGVGTISGGSGARWDGWRLCACVCAGV